MFSEFRQTEYKHLGTPTKKRKLNKETEMTGEDEIEIALTRKKSLIDCFQFIGAINRKDSSKFPLLRKQSISRKEVGAFEVSNFEYNDFFNKPLLNTEMEVENDRMESESESSEESRPREIKLVKRVTMQHFSQLDQGPQLYRCNSGIDIDLAINEADERKYGDNIYIEEINQLNRRNTKKSKENNPRAANEAFNKNFRQNYDKKAYQQSYDSDGDSNDQDQEERLLKDYEISNNLHAYVKNHENYLCLNKLERIFYYIKKINFSEEEYTENEVYDLCQSQMRLYNKDDEGHLLRFYQSWEEEDGVYLVFEMASTSLQEKLVSGIKLRENEVWSLLTDCSAALTWMKENDEYHLNIKPGNLLKCREKYKISDPFINRENFEKALAMFKGEEQEEQKLRIAFSYSAPEIIEYRSFIQGLKFDKCDVFSLGLSILENITGTPINLLKRALRSIKGNSEKYLRGYSPALRSLLIRMVSLDPSKRPTSEEICNKKLELIGIHNSNEKVGLKNRSMSC